MAAHEITRAMPIHPGGDYVVVRAARGCGSRLFAGSQLVLCEAGAMGALPAADSGARHLLGGACGKAVGKSSKSQASKLQRSSKLQLRWRMIGSWSFSGAWMLDGWSF